MADMEAVLILCMGEARSRWMPGWRTGIRHAIGAREFHNGVMLAPFIRHSFVSLCALMHAERFRSLLTALLNQLIVRASSDN